MEDSNDNPPVESKDTEEAPIAGIGTMVFEKWDASEVVCSDPGNFEIREPEDDRCSSHRGEACKCMVWKARFVGYREIHQQPDEIWKVQR